MRYAWRTQGLFAADPQEVGEHLEWLATERGGAFTKDDVLHDATKPDSPIYPLIERDDKKAADAFRETQAKGIVANLVVAKKGERKPKQRAFVFVRPEEAGSRGRKGFVPLATAMSHAALREQVIEAALGDLLSWFNRYSALREIRPYRHQIRQLKEEIETGLRAAVVG